MKVFVKCKRIVSIAGKESPEINCDKGRKVNMDVLCEKRSLGKKILLLE